MADGTLETPCSRSEEFAARVPVRQLWLNALLGYLAIGATIQVMPEFLRTAFSGGAFEAGLVVTVGFLATMAARPVAGRIADQAGARRVVLAGGLLATLGALGHLLATSLPGLVAARLILGLGEGTLFTASIGWVLSTTAHARRGRIAGRFGLSMWGGLAAGPILGTVLHSLFGFKAVWIFAGVLPLFGFLLLLVTPYRATEPAEPTIVRAWLPRAAWGPASSYVFASIGYGVVAAALSSRFKMLGIPGGELALPIYGIAFLGTRYFGSPLVDRYGAKRALVLAILTETCGLLGLSAAQSSASCLLLDAVTGTGLALTYPCYVAWVTERARPTERTAALGVVISAWDLGVALGGPLAGLLAGDAYAGAFAAAAVAAVIALVASVAAYRTKSTSHRLEDAA